MNRANTLLLTAAMAGAMAWKASANGFRLPDQDAFATARGEAFVATADNPSAIYYNPAGITQLEGENLRLGVYGIYFNPSYRPTNGAPNSGHTYHVENKLAAVPQFFYTYSPTNFPASLGFGVYAPFGGNLSWPQNTGFRSVAIDSSLTYISLNPVMALKLPAHLSAGAGLMVNYVNMEMSQGLKKNQLPSTNLFRFTGDGLSAGYNLGLLWQPHETVSIGATFRSWARVTLAGQTQVERQPDIPYATQPAQMDFTFPLSATMGISYRPTPKWNIEFDADYTDWSSLGSNSIHQVNPPPAVASDVALKLYWQPSWMYEFGVTRYFGSGWHTSVGFVYNENSVPNAYYTPLVADMDRFFFSAGTGYKSKHFNCDIAYQFGYGPTHTVTGSKPSSIPAVTTGQTADGKYDFISHAVIVSAGWRF